MKKISYVLVALLIIVMAYGCKKQSNEGVQVNSAPMETIDYAGFEKVMAEHKGKVVMVNFFGSWCPPCKIETPDFVETYENYKDKNFVIIGLAVDRNKADAVKFVNDFGVTYPVYQATEDLIRYFEVGPIPTSFVFTKDGTFLDKFIGYMSKDIVTKVAQLGGN